MDINNAVQYARHSFWGKIFFAHYKRIWGHAPDRTDSCHVRKVVFFLAPWYWFFHGGLFGTRVAPWLIFAVAIYALLAYMYAYLMAILTFYLLGTILFGIVAVGVSKMADEVDYAVARVARSIAKPVKNTWRIAFDWYEDIKSHVCKPVVWVDTNKAD